MSFQRLLLSISSIALPILLVCLCKFKTARSATLKVYGGLLYLHYRWSTPDPLPSTDSLTAHTAFQSPLAVPLLVVILLLGGNPWLACTLPNLLPPMLLLYRWRLHRPPLPRSPLRPEAVVDLALYLIAYDI